MNKKNKFLLVLKKIKEILNKDYPLKKKYQEVQLMGFKIHPLFGDIELLKDKEKEFIDSLWQIGKIEEIIAKNYKEISIEELNIILQMIDFLKNNNPFIIKEQKLTDKSGKENKLDLEMEIYQDLNKKKVIN